MEVVDRYIRTRRPVSSQELAAAYRHRFSPATIRNELLALEEEGYLRKPYPSSGRVPTAQGYRFFAHWLLDLAELEASPSRVPAERPEVELGQVPDLYRSTAAVLAAMTRELGFVVPPPRESVRLRGLILRRVGPGTVLAVAVSELGTAEPRFLSLDFDPTPEELLEAERFLGTWLSSHTLAEVPLLGEPVPEGWHSRAALGALSILRKLAEPAPERNLYVEGWPQLLGELAVRGSDWALERGQELLRLLEEGRAFGELLGRLRAAGAGLTVHVGDGSIPELRDLSLVAAPYLGGAGVVGVIGPLWMDYARAYSASRYVAGRLGAILGAGKGER